jgi:hypothetical protein
MFLDTESLSLSLTSLVKKLMSAEDRSGVALVVNGLDSMEMVDGTLPKVQHS